MSVEELALDTGIRENTAEYDSFVGCVRSILDYGCSYSPETMSNIRRRCRTSQMPLAQEVLDECERVQSSKTRIRRSNPKWWQAYVPQNNSQGRKDQGRKDQGRRDQGRKDQGRRDQGRRDQGRRDQGRRDQGRKMSPLFTEKPGKRTMSPMFRRPQNKRRAEDRPERRSTEDGVQLHRPDNQSGPAWPSRKRRRR